MARQRHLLEEPDRAVLQIAIEIDHHVAAGDELHFSENLIGHQL